MKKFLALAPLFFVLASLSGIAQPLSGNYTINNTANTGGTNFKTVTEAVNALNSNGVNGAVTFNISAGQVFTEIVPVITVSGTATNTIVFKKSGIGANPVIRRVDDGTINTSVLGGAGDAVIVLQGADFISFDSLHIRSENKGIEYGFLIKKESATNGAKNISIKNDSIILKGDSSKYAAAIYFSNLGADTTAASASGVSVTTTDGIHDNINITGNVIRNVVNGVQMIGSQAVSVFDQLGTGTVTSNSIQSFGSMAADTAFGIYLSYYRPSAIAGNIISNAGYTGARSKNYYGIYQANINAAGVSVINNSIASLNADGFVCGIYFSSLIGTSATIGTNTIGSITAKGMGYGITVENVNGVNTTVSNNSIGTIECGSAYGLMLAPGAATLNVFKNKIYGLASKSKTAPDAVYGIYLGNGNTTRIYNNLIGDFRADSLSNPFAITGIYCATLTASSSVGVFYNTVYLNTSISNYPFHFGSAALYAMASSVATTAALDLRNNILVNTSQRRGLGLTVAFRRSGTALANYAVTSNNNLYYAGTPGVANLIYYDGVNTDDRFSAFRIRVGQSVNSSRDINSVTENPPFQSVSGATANFLHINNTVSTFVESGGIAVTGITDDYDAQARTGTPDIGADEMTGIAKSRGMIVTDFSTAIAPIPPAAQNDSIAVWLARKIMGKGVNLVNCKTGSPLTRDYPRYTGTPTSAGIFSNGIGAVDLEEGIVLTNGRAQTSASGTGVNGPSSLGPSNNLNLPGDPAWLDEYLKALPNPTGANRATQDASTLKFSFVPEGDIIEFNYVFTSQEYAGFTCSQYTDIFAFLLIGGDGVPSSPMDKNIAKVPGTSFPVAINTVNRGPAGATQQTFCPAGQFFPQYYIDNSPGIPPTSLYLTHKGKTVVLKAIYTGIKPCTKYSILIGIADVSDGNLDSGVFIEANSFKSPDYGFATESGFNITDTTVTAVEGCREAQIKIRLKAPMPQPVAMALSYSGSATKNVDYKAPGGVNMPDTLFFAAGEVEKTITIVPVIDNITEGNEKVVIRPKTSDCRAAISTLTCIPANNLALSDSIVVFIKDSINFGHRADTVTCSFPMNITATIDTLAVQNSLVSQFSWNTVPVKTTQTISVDSPGTYIYSNHFFINGSTYEGCYNVDTIKVIGGYPKPSFTLTPKQICEGDSVLVTPGPETSTKWYWTYNNHIDSFTNNNPFKIGFSSYGQYRITDSIVSTTPCPSKIAFDTITVYAKPNIGFIYPKGCLPANGIVQFQDTSYVPDSTRQTINSWLWNFGDKNATPANPNTATIKNPSHIYGYGSDTLSLKITTDKGCWRDSVWVDTFKISPVVALQPVDSVCYGIAPFSIATKASVTNAVPGTGYFKGNGIDSAGLFNTITAGVGAHTIWYVFTSNTGCKDSVSRIIKVNALPKVNFGFPDTCLAPNGFVQFSDSSTIGNSETISKYSWNFGDVNATGSNPNTSTQKNASHYFIKEGTYAVKLSDTTAFGCYSDTTINVAVKIKPALTFASLAALCENATAITLTDSVKITNGLTGTNAFSGTGITGSTFNPAIAGAGNNQPIKYVFTTTGGCSDSLSRTITVHAKPKSSFSAPDSCLSPNGYVQFTHSSTIGNSETISKYSWNFGDVNATGSNPNTSTQKNASHYFIKEGTYAVKLSDTTSFGCYSDTTINVAVKIKPALTFASLAALCENATAITLTDSVKVTNGLSGTGSFTGTGITGSGFNPATATAGTYNLTYSYTTTGGCTANISKPITVKAVPNPAFTYPSGCLSTSGLVQFTNTTVPASGTTIQGYTWNFGDATNIGPGNPNTSTAVNPSHNYVQGTYTIKLTAAYTNGCSNEKTETVTFNTTPLLAAPAIVPGICDNTGTTLTLNGPAVTNAVPGTGVFSGTGITNGTAGTFDAAVAGTGTHNITYTYTSTANSNCKATATIPVKVFAKPTASFTVNPTAVCLDAKPTFTNTSTIASPYKIAKWEWDFGDAQTQQSTTAPVPFTHTYAAAGSYAVTLKLTSDSGCVVSSAPQNVKVNPLPVIDSMGIPAVICMPSGRAQFTGKGSISDNTTLNYAWTFGDGGTSSAKDPLYVYASSGSGSYNATLTVTSAVTGCKQTLTKTVNGFSTQPTAKFSTAVDLCQGTPSVFNNQSTAGSAPVNQYIWDFGDGSGAPPTSTKNPEKTYSSPGTYNVSLIVRDDKGCESNPAYKMDVTVHLQPKVDAGPNLVLKQGEYGQFKPKVNDSVSVTLTWSAQAGLPSGIVDPSVLSAWVRGIANDTWYYLTGVGDYSCSAKDSVLVKVLKTIRIPNSFSPNGDGINDRWLIEGLVDYPGHSVEVFNRQGVRVYSSFRYQTPWDGTYNTKALPAGTYYYIIDPKNGIPAMTGWVLISK